MSPGEILKPYTEFNAEELAAQLRESVWASEDLLRTRNLGGVVIRYAQDIGTATSNVQKGQAESDPQHFAIVGQSGDVVGAASIYNNLLLRKLRLPIPPHAAAGRLAVPFPHAKPNIHAWTTEGAEEELYWAYEQLIRKVPTHNPHDAAWTIEPARSPEFVHTAIRMTGLQKIATRYWDDAESHSHIPPRSTLYAALHGEWLTSHGNQKALRKGLGLSWLDKLMKDDEFDGRMAGLGKG